MSIVYQSESDSRKLLESSWWLNPKKNYPLPVDPVILAVKLGIKVKISFLPSDVSGETSIPYMGNPEISLNKNDELTRNRFACAHGIGHYIHSRNSTNWPAVKMSVLLSSSVNVRFARRCPIRTWMPRLGRVRTSLCVPSLNVRFQVAGGNTCLPPPNNCLV
jgi:hypothetical protein